MRDVRIKTEFTLPPCNEREIFRYAGGKGDVDETTRARIRECIALAAPVLSYKVCYLPLTRSEFFSVFGESALARTYLGDCEEVVIFGGTLGIGLDRLIFRYAGAQPSNALLLQALGAERVETLCDEFCKMLSAEYAAQGLTLGRRFSAGYGDFPLERQRDFFALLDCGRKIGLTLNESLIMSPSKSVTAAVGIFKK